MCLIGLLATRCDSLYLPPQVPLAPLACIMRMNHTSLTSFDYFTTPTMHHADRNYASYNLALHKNV